MERALAPVFLAAAVVTLAGCGSSAHTIQDRANHPPLVKGRTAGLLLSKVPASYRPPLSSSDVLGRIKGLRTSNPDAHLWMVNGAYPAWVFTSDCQHGTKVSIYDLRGRRWTMSSCVPLHFAAAACSEGFCGTPLNQGGLDMAAGDAERIAGAAHVFAGDRVDDPTDTVILHLVHAPQSVVDALNAAHPGTYVIYNGAPRTYHDVRVLQNSLDWPAWKAKGVRIVSTGPTENGHLQVGVTSNVANAQALFDAAYGRGVVKVVHGEPAFAA